MKTSIFVMALMATVLFGTANAQTTPCCAAEADESSPNFGKACTEADEGTFSTDGCAEEDSTGTCVGGTVNGDGNTGPAGCVCIGGQCATDAGPVEPGDCTSAAVAACCDVQACN